MFEIAFLDEPVPNYLLGTNQQVSYAQITIEDFREKLIIPLDYWNREDYRKQWLNGVDRLITQRGNISALFTGMYDFALSNFGPMCWLLYRESGTDTVNVQNQWLPRETLPVRFDPYEWYDRLPPRETHSEGDQISEWKTTITALSIWRSKLSEVGDSSAT